MFCEGPRQLECDEFVENGRAHNTHDLIFTTSVILNCRNE